MHTALFQTLASVVNVHLFDIGGRPVTLASLATSIAIFVMAYIASLLAQRGIGRALNRRGVEDAGSVHVASRLTHYVFLMTGLAVALQTAGIELGALFTAGAVFAVGIGFGMQNIAQNFVSGVILLVEHSIKPGDVLELDGYLVRVVEMGVRATRVRTRDDEVLIVPNGLLVQSTVKSYTLLDPLYRVRVKVGVSYDSDMDLVRKTLEDVARDMKKRSLLREPMILLIDFAASAVDWEVSIWTADPWEYRPLASQLREAMWKGFQKNGIRVAFPQIDVHLDAPVVDALSRRAA